MTNWNVDFGPGFDVKTLHGDQAVVQADQAHSFTLDNRMTVACVFVKGPYPYTADYVVRLERMVRRHLSRPFRFVCFTDQPWLFSAPIETVPIAATLPGDPRANGYWTKLHVFNPAHRLAGRVLFLDLDVLVVADLAPLVDYPAPFALCADEMALERPAVAVDSIGRTILRRFNASAMVFEGGTHADLWQAWTPDVTRRLQGDQDWYAERCPYAAAMPVEWFPRLSRIPGPPFAPEAKVVLSKKPKNAIAAKQFPWFEPLWGGWAA